MDSLDVGARMAYTSADAEEESVSGSRCAQGAAGGAAIVVCDEADSVVSLRGGMLSRYAVVEPVFKVSKATDPSAEQRGDGRSGKFTLVDQSAAFMLSGCGQNAFGGSQRGCVCPFSPGWVGSSMFVGGPTKYFPLVSWGLSLAVSFISEWPHLS